MRTVTRRAATAQGRALRREAVLPTWGGRALCGWDRLVTSRRGRRPEVHWAGSDGGPVQEGRFRPGQRGPGFLSPADPLPRAHRVPASVLLSL